MHATPESPVPFDVSVETHPDLTTVVLSGELDIATADVARDALGALEKPVGGRLVIDLTNVGFMDSTGLRLLITAYRDATKGGYEFTVVTGDSPAKRVLELTRMDEHIHVVPQLD